MDRAQEAGATRQARPAAGPPDQPAARLVTVAFPVEARGSAGAPLPDRRPSLHNDLAVPEIRTGAKAFNCIGASPPHDHPHIYLSMGGAETLNCPYCATRYRYDAALTPRETDPPGCLFVDPSWPADTTRQPR